MHSTTERRDWMSRYGNVLGVALVVLVGFCAYANGLHNRFVWDDYYFVGLNEAIRSLPAAFAHFFATGLQQQGLDPQIWRPLRNLSYAIDYSLWGRHPFGFHLTNLLLHLLTATALFGLTRRVTRSRVAALAAGALFAVHPVLTEAVAWIKGRDDLLAALCFVLAVRVFYEFLETPRFRPWRWMVLALVAAALLSKESALCLVPTMLLLYVFRRMPATGGEPKAGLSSVASVGAVCAGTTILYVAVRSMVLGQVGQCGWFTGSAATTLLTMVHVLVYYFTLVLFPYALTCDYSNFPVVRSAFDPILVSSVLLLAILGIALFRYRRQSPWVVFGVLWFLVNLLPVSNIVPTMQLLAERFLYLPVAGACLAGGAWFARAVNRARAAGRRRVLIPWTVFVLLLLLLGARTVRRNADWYNSRTLFESALKVSPSNRRIRGLLAIGCINTGDYAGVVDLLDGWTTTSSRDPQPMRNLGKALYETGHRDRGLLLLHAAREADPTWAEPLEDIAHAAVQEHRAGEAVKWFSAAVKCDPLNARRWINLGIALRDRADIPAARRALRYAIRLKPDNAAPYRTLAAIAWQEGDFEAARAYFRKILSIAPGDKQALHWLAVLGTDARSSEDSNTSGGPADSGR